MILCEGDTITATQLTEIPSFSSRSEPRALSESGSGEHTRSIHEAVMEMKREYILDALKRSGGSIMRAAMLLKVSRDSLKHMMKTLGIRRR